MHIPDGFLNIPVSAGAAALSVGGLTFSLRRLKRRLAERLVPTMGVLAAFIFAAQMFNFPVAGGTSGHLLGGVLAAIMVGPAAASVVLTVVLIIQCLLFQDGGLVALGANILNIALLGTWIGWGIYAALSRLGGRFWRCAGIFAGSWFSVVAAATACAAELAISDTISIRIALPAMVGVHAIIGIGEGIITLLIVSFVQRVKPELVSCT